MAKIELLRLKKVDREKYPHLRTITELKKEKLMPKPRVKPRAIYTYYTPYGSKPEETYLYDRALTCPLKLSEAEKKERRRKDKDRREKKKQNQLLKERIQELSSKIKPSQTVVFDVETTGLDPVHDEIIQFSAINGDGKVLLNTYVKPVRHTTWREAERVNGISPDMVKDMPTINDLWETIQSIFLSANLLIAYNGSFDIEFLRSAKIFVPDVEYYDVMFSFAEIYGEWNDYYGEYKWQKLSKCAEYYGYEFKAHDSLEDVKATLYCYNKICNQ